MRAFFFLPPHLLLSRLDSNLQISANSNFWKNVQSEKEAEMRGGLFQVKKTGVLYRARAKQIMMEREAEKKKKRHRGGEEHGGRTEEEVPKGEPWW